jgi:hypothetical protein
LSKEIDRAPFGWGETNAGVKVYQHKDLEHSEKIVIMNEKEIYVDLNESGMRISGKRLLDI